MKKKFCSRPFEHLHMDPNGKVRICSWTDEVVGNLLEESIEDIWDGERADKIRESIIDGSYKYCRATSCPYLENDSLPYVTEEEMAQLAVKTEKPMNFNVACDYICNHSCPSCRDSIFVGDETYKENLQITIDKLIPYLNAADSFSTCGNGDVFSSPQMMSMLEELQPENEDLTISIETNGVLFDEQHWKKIEHLAKYKIRVAVTPNSFEPRTFRYLNGGHNTYDKMIQNLYFIKELRKKGLVDFFEISMVMQDRNFWELPDFVERCLYDFEADMVTVKPIYRWFGLSEDLFWYKDVLNPKHPYHKEYLDMMKDPVLNDSRVYFWGAKNLHEAQDHPAYRNKEYLQLIAQMLETEDVGNKIKQYFEKQKLAKFYIYGDMELSPIICRIFEKAIPVQGFIARDTNKESICGKPIIRMCDYQSQEGDVVLVLNYQFFNNIKRDFDFSEFKGTLIRLDEMVKGL